MDDQLDSIENTVLSLWPDEHRRYAFLTRFLKHIYQANEYGAHKWGVFCRKDGLRLVVGGFRVAHFGSEWLWLALDSELLGKQPDWKHELDTSKLWRWDNSDYPTYSRIPSRNGYFYPLDADSTVEHIVGKLHCRFVGRAATQCQSLYKRSQGTHMRVLLVYLRRELVQSVPEACYDEQRVERNRYMDQAGYPLPDEVPDDVSLYEGKKKQVTVDVYKRSLAARQKCIERYGARCTVCGFDFEQVYGPVGKGVIHVHHLRPLSQSMDSHPVKPEEDLRPVCPNCHAIIHCRMPPFSIDEIRGFLKEARYPREQDIGQERE